MNQAKKEINFYMEKMDLKKTVDKMEERKMKKFEKLAEKGDISDEDNNE
jgi:hypothetical protein